jgi:long-chain acyl-CoA synthetase
MNSQTQHTTLLSYLDDFLLRGDTVAFVGRKGLRTDRWSYRKVAETASLMAAELEQRGLVRGDRVLLWSENSPAWVAVFFGCMSQGIVIVPLDIQSSDKFVQCVQDQVKSKLLLVGGGVDPSRLSLPIPTVSLDEFIVSSLSHPPFNKMPSVAPNDVVEIVFTSGTTSEPRGVCLSHMNILSNLLPLEKEIRRYQWQERLFRPVRFLNLVPLSHVFGQLMGMLIPQLLGGEVWFYNSFKPAEVLKVVKHRRILVLVTVPRFLDTLKETIEKEFDGRREALFPLRPTCSGFLKSIWQGRAVHQLLGWKFWAFVSGGATLNPATGAFWRQLGFAVVQGYGMTETAALISVVHPFKPRQGSIGKVLPGREVKLNPDGEILVRGSSVTPGLWDQSGLGDKLTDEHGWLHTGDLAQKDSEDNLYFKGRQKEVIVTSAGLNIYPEDLELALNQQPEIRACAVIGVERKHGPVPLAVILLKEGGNPQHAVEQANRMLASHQQILHWTVWPERDFPRTSNQKIRKRDLVSRMNLSSEDGFPFRFVESQDQEFLVVKRLIAQIVGKELAEVDRNSHLASDLKLDSIGRVALLSALEEEYRTDIDENDFSAADTLGDIEDLILNQEQLGGSPIETSLESATEPFQPVSEQVIAVPRVRAESLPYPLPHWTLRFPFTWLRRCFSRTVLLPLTRLLARPVVYGLDNLKGISPPILFIANHVTFLDPVLVLAALPKRFQQALTVAMDGEKLRDWRYTQAKPWTRCIFYRLLYLFVVALFNTFSLPQRSSFRRSFEYAGEAMDLGYNVLVFPEGARTKDGKMAPFRDGIGLLASGLNATIVPLKVEGLFGVKERFLTRKTTIPHARAGELSIGFGKPIQPASLGELRQIPRILENVLANLSCGK